jgi:hypothetical protein
VTGTIDRIRDATIRANNVAELRAFYGPIQLRPEWSEYG